MKLKFSIKRQVQISPDALEDKINEYLKKNFYRVIERGAGFIFFVEDEFSTRRSSKGDYYSRIEEGRFEFQSTNHGAIIKLTYFVPVLYEIFSVMLFIVVGLYAHSIIAVLPVALVINFGYKIYYLNEHVLNNLLES